MRVAILLAAGSSRRFTGANKLLARRDGPTVVARALAAALAAPVARVIVVVGHDRHRVAAEVRHPRVQVVHARDHRDGVSASLRAGLAALRPIERQLFVYLGDMPGVPPPLARRIARAMRLGVAAVRPRRGGMPDHPVLLRRPDRATIARLGGDRGLAPLLAGRICWIDLPGAAARDIDTRRDFARWRTFARRDG